MIETPSPTTIGSGGRVCRHISGSYPSLYVNLAADHLKLDERDAAREWHTGAYLDKVDPSIDNLIDTVDSLKGVVMSTLAEQERKLLDLLTRSVHRTFADARAAGVPADVFDDVEGIARSMASALPNSHVYDQLVGPFYDTTGLTRWWGVSRQAIAKAASTGTVIACRLDGGGWVYPTWQFTDSGSVHPDLITLWTTLRGGADAWTCAVWLRSPHPDLDNSSAARWVAEGRPLEAALELARADVVRWAA